MADQSWYHTDSEEELDNVPLLDDKNQGNDEESVPSSTEFGIQMDEFTDPKGNEINGNLITVKNVRVKTRTQRKQIGLLHGVAFIVGTMIGSGIFVSPRFVMANSGSVGLMLTVWTLCGVVSLLGALCYVELGTLISKSGGEYTYIKEGFGNLSAFIVLWTYTLILKPLSLAVLSLSFAYYACLPVCQQFQPECRPEAVIKLIAVVCVGINTLVNCLSINWALRVQVFFTAAKLLAIIWIILLGIYNLVMGQTTSFDKFFGGTNHNLGEIGHAFYSGLWAFDGWNQLNYVVEELKNPRKNLQRAILIALPLVTTCYVLVNIAYLTVLSPAQLAASDTVAFTVVERTMGGVAWFLPLLVACSCYGALNGSVFSSGRQLSVASRDGLSPKLLSMFQRKTLSPLPAILFNSSLGIIAIFLRNIGDLLNYCSFTVWIMYGLTMVSLVVLRWKLPHQHRPYKVFIGFPLIMTLVAAYLVIIPLVSFPIESCLMLLVILLAIPVYLIFISGYQYLPTCLKDFQVNMTCRLKAIFDLVEPSE